MKVLYKVIERPGMSVEVDLVAFQDGCNNYDLDEMGNIIFKETQCDLALTEKYQDTKISYKVGQVKYS